MFVSLEDILERVKAKTLKEGAPCAPGNIDIVLSDDLYLSGNTAVLKTPEGHRCLDIGILSEGIQSVAYLRIVKQAQFKTLEPPYVEISGDEDRYLVLGVYNNKVYMAEWSGIRLCCSWIVDISLDEYKKSYEILKTYI
ncbi:hypothetical protein [Thermoproteus tenax]|uniref:Uncharacterized protein n=1 Tax=Thermoproteus tenax (strain ATCC 35583 / DSM 2078 / JCM 9277 / NBRC 100435 / Kra 1) TaxID=768679 RepID=G4RNZ8_THETK|nr:hypothetical protein [Thermoproteus tenax]CCC81292.1 hypothetical protein TTX_0632 [Thermoproteus tenax Kra 1]